MKNLSSILAAVLTASTLLSIPTAATAGGNFSWSISGGHGGGYGHHNGHNGHGHGQYTPKPFRICFYSRTNFRGRHFCESSFQNKNRVGHNWRHKIKSIKIIRNGPQGRHSPSIRLCNGFDGSGYCKTYYRGSARLNDALYRHVYSYNINQ